MSRARRQPMPRAAPRRGAAALAAALAAGALLAGLLAAPAASAQGAGRRPPPDPKPEIAAALLRGPYLQQGSSTGVLVCWRTDAATSSRVFYGSAPGSLPQSAGSAALTREHRVLLSGLEPNTRYYYAVGSAAGILYGDATTFFHTAPETGSPQPLRLWVIGDSGTGDINARAVYQAFRAYSGGQRVDGWLMLGDNAYQLGTDAEYQTAVFETYPEMLRQVPLWPAYGNHDGQSADAIAQTGVYFDIFEPPTAGQAGGVPSGTEAYYSFDLGNLHVAVLDSYETRRAPDGAMAAWLDADLAASNADWLVVAFHHPPYSKGSHYSDFEIEMVEMRQSFGPILEARGVDLVLAGHSHSYERSMLIDGHYGMSTSFSASMIKDAGDGHLDGDGAYLKPPGLVPHEGTVYMVVGVSGSYSLGGELDHPVMRVNYRKLGSLALEIDGPRLDAKLIDPLGGVVDHFTMAKGVDPCPEDDLVAAGALWKYRDDGVDLGQAWRQPAYADGAWPEGPAELGYGDGDEATVISFGPNPLAKYPTSYFRRHFQVADPAAVEALELRVRRDDGVAVYLNGVPVVKDNFAQHSITWGSWALAPIGGLDETFWQNFRIDKSLLRPGGNLLAAEVHQAGPASTDLTFDLALRARRCRAAP